MLSIIVPCFNEEKALPFYYQNFCQYKGELGSYELILVNDGSKDNTLKIAKELKEKDNNITIINFSRNFGKEAAMYAGLKEASGDYVVIMDCDLQDPPSLLPEMLRFLKKNQDYDSVATYRVNRKGEPPIRSFFARTFYHLINKFIAFNIVDGARDYRLMRRRMVDAILSLEERNRFSKGIFAWVGFKTKYLEYENIERVAGESKWSFWKLFFYAIDGIVGFTTAPLKIATLCGCIISLLSFIYMLFIVFKALLYGDPVAGFPSIIVVISMLGGIQLVVLGIIGEYLGKTYLEVKKRPLYVIREKIK